MKNVLKTVLVVFVLCITVTSCSKSSLSEEDALSHIATEGDDEEVKKKPEE